MKIFSKILIPIFLINFSINSCTNKPNSTKLTASSAVSSIIDSVKLILCKRDSLIDCNDSIKVIFATKKFETIILIDYNYYSKLHDQLPHEKKISFFSKSDSSYYSQQYLNQSRNKGKTMIIPNDLKTVWIQVFSFKNCFYLLADYPYQDFFETNDTTFIIRGEMGPEPYVLDSIETNDRNITLISKKISPIILERVKQERSLYKLSIRDKKYFIIPVEEIHEYPLIYHCSSVDPIHGISDFIQLDSIK
jgi:hypothetical protein